ncbi:hypothetical protein EGW08_015874 [Elysia chlorotica]|uniref:Sulfatase N-terminal domain-containing protein n=1 Tax=Elysia chlorotica TaxID=188477 RepID=A0A433T491_ELYCH|nr:hypothetical protein EGW08_015874 [Elysia chlorotica]
MHIVDWYPTLAEAAGIPYDASDQDGVSQWQSLVSLATPSNREEVVYNLDLSWDPIQGRAAIRVGDYKLIAGYPGLYSEWYPLPDSASCHVSQDDLAAHASLERVAGMGGGVFGGDTRSWRGTDFDATAPSFYYLFNLKDDPEERRNLYSSEPDVVRRLASRLDAHRARYVQPNFPVPSPQADPALYGGVWTPGWCPDISG